MVLARVAVFHETQNLSGEILCLRRECRVLHSVRAGRRTSCIQVMIWLDRGLGNEMYGKQGFPQGQRPVHQFIPWQVSSSAETRAVMDNTLPSKWVRSKNNFTNVGGKFIIHWKRQPDGTGLRLAALA